MILELIEHLTEEAAKRQLDFLVIGAAMRSSAWLTASDHGCGFFRFPRHMVALKLHAARSPSRSEPSKDWNDIRPLIREARSLDPADREFATLVVRYGGE